MKNEHDPLSRPEEWAAPPEEFPSPAPEALPPPEEFPPSAGPDQPSPGRRRRLLYLLAAGALILLLAGKFRGAPSLPALLPAPAVSAEPTLTPAPAPSPTAAPTPEPTPEPTPTPTPEPEPSCEILFYHFSSANYVHLSLTRPEAFRSVSLELREPVLDLPVESLVLSPEDLAAGELDLPEMDTGELYFAHRDEYEAQHAFPEELALHAVLVYNKDGQTLTEERELTASPEQGWSVRYWPKDTEKEDWNFPGCFRFETYESELPVSLVLDDPEAVGPGVISVSFAIDGRKVDPALIRYDLRHEAYTIGGEAFGPPFYHARFLFEKPDWAPEEGVLQVTVVQYLEGYGRILALERAYPYSEHPEEPG